MPALDYWAVAADAAAAAAAGVVLCDTEAHVFGPLSKEELHEPLSLESTVLLHFLKKGYKQLSPANTAPCIMKEISALEELEHEWIVDGLEAYVSRRDGSPLTSSEQFELGFNSLDTPNIDDIIRVFVGSGLLVAVKGYRWKNWNVQWGSRTINTFSWGDSAKTIFDQTTFKDGVVTSKEIWRYRSVCTRAYCSHYTEKYIFGKEQTLAVRGGCLTWTCKETTTFPEHMWREDEALYKDLVTTWVLSCKRTGS